MTALNAKHSPAAGTSEGLFVIDADSHFSEPADLWTSRAPASIRDRVPRVVEGEGRIGTWVVEDTAFANAIGWSAVMPDGGKVSIGGVSKTRLDEIHPASNDPVARLKMIDQLGIYAQVLYPNVGGFGSQRFGEIGDAALRQACVEIYNDYMAEYQESSGNRLLPMAGVPWWDPKACVKEVRRAAKLGLRGINMASDPQDMAGVPDLGDVAWRPFWEACCEENMPVNFHIGSSQSVTDWRAGTAWPSLTEPMRYLMGGVMIFLGNAKVITNMILSGVLERHPDLKIVSVESGVGWLPFLAEALDYQGAELGSDRDVLSLKPSEYMRRQVYSCFWFETLNEGVLKTFGEDNIMFETDFPHPTCLYPDSVKRAEATLASRSPQFRRKVLQDNAANLYKVRVPVLA